MPVDSPRPNAIIARAKTHAGKGWARRPADAVLDAPLRLSNSWMDPGSQWVIGPPAR